MPRRRVDSARVRLELAHTLRDLRVSQGWTQLELSERCGIDTRTLSAYEQATRNAPIESLVAIFDAYGLLLTEALADVYPFGTTRAPRKRPLEKRIGRPPA